MISFSLNTFSQNGIKIDFRVAIKDIPIVLNDSTYLLDNAKTVHFTTLKFYMSSLMFLHDDKIVFTEPNSFHLIDLSDTNSQNILLKFSKAFSYNKIRFNIGIDSITNVSGARGGDLDPTKGMYWTWNSGYINCKIEGDYGLDTNPKQNFEFHLGGYQYPFSALQTVELSLKNTSNISLILDLNKFFEQLDLSKQKNILSPCMQAVNFSQQLIKCFILK